MQSDQLKLFGIRECLDPALDPTPKAAALITHRTRRGTLPCGAPLPLLRVVHCDLSGRGLLLGPLRVFLKGGFRPIAVLFLASEVLVQSDSGRILPLCCLCVVFFSSYLTQTFLDQTGLIHSRKTGPNPFLAFCDIFTRSLSKKETLVVLVHALLLVWVSTAKVPMASASSDHSNDDSPFSPYEVLGVPKSATVREIQAAFRKKASVLCCTRAPPPTS